jgi:hypothetical protein
MLKQFVIRIEFNVVYPTCLEPCDARALKISAIVHFLFKSYGISNPILAAVQTAKQSLGTGIFEQLKVGILSRVEYQSCVECYNNRARQNSAFLLKSRENYGVFGECRLAARTAR